jgi:hypothetical protein
MGRAARNPSQRAQAMGFAQLNPSYKGTPRRSGSAIKRRPESVEAATVPDIAH